MKIRELLTDESKWIKDVFAVDAEGNSTKSNDPNAVSWCLYGAIERCYLDDSDKIAILIRKELHIKAIAQWNDEDDRKFEEVKALVERLDI